MRRNLVPIVAGALLLATSAPADADKAELNASEFRDKLIVLHDGNGHYIATERLDSKPERTFYGNGKRFYLQSTGSAGGSKKTMRWTMRIWSPRSPHGARLYQDKDKFSVSCDPKKPVSFTQLGAAEATKLLKRAKFFPRLVNRSIRVLGRDEDANYYLVDSAPSANRGQRAFEYRDLRIFRGPAGRMKRLKVKELASDAEGMVIVTKAGNLLYHRDTKGKQQNNKIVWKSKGTKRKPAVKTELRQIDPIYNRYMVYSTLGVYPERLGTPCDDLYVN